jgi:hypothetical protein
MSIFSVGGRKYLQSGNAHVSMIQVMGALCLIGLVILVVSIIGKL